jgi:hypothetical protein
MPAVNKSSRQGNVLLPKFYFKRWHFKKTSYRHIVP